MTPNTKATFEKSPFQYELEDEKSMDGNYAEDDKRDFEEDSMESLTHQNQSKS